MQEQSIFMAVLEKTDPVERAAILDEMCQGNGPLRERIERLLQRHAQAGSFLDVLPPDGLHSPEGPGTTLGPYSLMASPT